MMKKKASYRIMLSMFLAGTMMTPVYAQTVNTKDDTELGIPKVLVRDKTGKGDNLGDHTATGTLNMSGSDITNVITIGSDGTSAVNVDFLRNMISNPDEIAGDNLGDHLATTVLNMSGYKITNAGNAYGGDNGDVVNIWTLNQYLDDLPGPDNLGNHVAVQNLFLNGNNINMGSITGTDQNGQPITNIGLTISPTMITNLSSPVNPTDATNKEYVDGLISKIDLSKVVYTIGDQTISGIKTFVQPINVLGGITMNNQKIINLGDPVDPADAVNLRTLDKKIGNIGLYKGGDGIVIRPPEADGYRPVSVDASVVRTSGAQSIAGQKTFGSSVIFNLKTVHANSSKAEFTSLNGNILQAGYNDQDAFIMRATSASPGTIQIETREGRDGKINLFAHDILIETKNLSTGWGNRSGDGGDIILRTAPPGVSSTVAGNVILEPGGTNGLVMARKDVDLTNNNIINLADPVNPQDAVNLRTLQTYQSFYTPGDGIVFSSPDASGRVTISTSNNVVRTFGNQTIDGIKTFNQRINFNVPETGSLGGYMMHDRIMSNASAYQFFFGPPSGPINIAGDSTNTVTHSHSTAIRTESDSTSGKISFIVNRNDSQGRNNGWGEILVITQDSVTSTRDIRMRRAGGVTGEIPGGNIWMEDGGIKNLADPVQLKDAVNLRTLRTAYTGSNGVSVTNQVISLDNTVVRTTGDQSIAGQKTFNSSVVVNGNVTAQGFITSSDRRLKDNLVEMSADDADMVLDAITPYTFTYKDSGKRASGVIAQDVIKVMPWAVETRQDGMMSVDYTQMVSPLIASVKSQDDRIDVLEEMVSEEKVRNDMLEARLLALEEAAIQ